MAKGTADAGLTCLGSRCPVAATEERWWEAEVYRLQGVLLLQRSPSDVDAAEACPQQALDVAQGEQGEALEGCARAEPESAMAAAGQPPRRTRAWPRSTAGSRRALTPPTSRSQSVG